MLLSHNIITVLLFGFTGWLTTWLLLKLLFHPRKPVNVLGVRLQGMLPKNQRSIAEKLGGLVSNEFSFDTIRQKATDPATLAKLKPEIEKHIDIFLREKLKDSFPMLSMFIGDKTINQMKGAFLLELETLFPILVKNYISNLEQEIDLQKTVTDKVAGFSMEKMEDMLGKLAGKQVMYIHLMSTSIGIIIGLLYVLVVMQLH